MWLSFIAGAVMLAWPLVWPSAYLAAPIWLGFIFLLEPVNARLGGERLGDRRNDRLVISQQADCSAVPLGVLELLGGRKVALHRADHGERQDLRDAVAWLSWLSRVRAGMLHHVCPGADAAAPRGTGLPVGL
jgi:hypothetical protein